MTIKSKTSKLVNLIDETITGLKNGLVGTLNVTNTAVTRVSKATDYVSKKSNDLAEYIEDSSKNRKGAKMIDYLKGLTKEINKETGEKISVAELVRYIASETSNKIYQEYLNKKDQGQEYSDKVAEILRRYQYARESI